MRCVVWETVNATRVQQFLAGLLLAFETSQKVRFPAKTSLQRSRAGPSMRDRFGPPHILVCSCRTRRRTTRLCTTPLPDQPDTSIYIACPGPSQLRLSRLARRVPRHTHVHHALRQAMDKAKSLSITYEPYRSLPRSPSDTRHLAVSSSAPSPSPAMSAPASPSTSPSTPASSSSPPPR